MHPISQSLFEVIAKDQGEKFRTIIGLAQKATDADWTIIMEKIQYLADQGLAYLKQIEDFDGEAPAAEPIDDSLPL